MKRSMILILSAALLGSAWASESKGTAKAPEQKYFRTQYTPAVTQVGVIPEGVFGFFDPGEDATFLLMVESKAKDLEYEVSVKDDSGREVYHIPRKKLENSFRVPGQPCGYYVVDTDIFANGKKAYSMQSAFAVNVPPAKRDPFFQMGFGVFADLIPGYKRIGVGSLVLRMRSLGIISPSNLNRSLEESVEGFMAHQKPFLDDPDFVLTHYVPCTLQAALRSKEEFKAGWPLISDRLLQLQMDYVRIIHERTKDRVREWTIGCEIPSNALSGAAGKTLCATWTEAMFNMMLRARMISRALKSVDPGIRIIVGGNNRQEFTDSIERIVLSDLVNDFDEYAIDGYTGNWDMRKGKHSIPELKLMDFYKAASDLSFSLGKGKVIRNDETGYAINYGARYDRGLAVEQADLTARTIIITRYAPVSRFELHKPSDIHWFKESCQDDARTLTTIWKPFRFWPEKKFYHIPLPGGAMYATASAELAFVQSLAEVKNGNIYSYLFRKPDGSVLITVWNIAEKQLFRCSFPEDTRAVNMYGRSIPVKDLTIGQSPVYITVKMNPEDAVAMMKKAVLANSPEFQCLADGSRILIRNFSDEPKVCRIQLPGRPEFEQTVAPDKVNVIEADVTEDGKLVAPDGRTYRIPLQKTQFFPIPKLKSKPVFDGSGSWLEGLPYGELNYPDDIRPQEALQPERCYFKTDFNPNGHNISARYWGAYDDEYFYLAVKVDDPVHQQRKTPAEQWKDDCLQFLLSHEDGTNSLTEPVRRPKSEYNFGLALSPQGPRLMKFLGNDRGLKNYPANVTRSGDTTFYEVAIPWNEVGGRVKRFGFVVFNNDWPTVERAPYYLAFSDGVVGQNDAKLKVVQYGD